MVHLVCLSTLIPHILLGDVNFMSLGYAQKLSFHPDVGEVGMPERQDAPSAFEDKVHESHEFDGQSGHILQRQCSWICTSAAEKCDPSHSNLKLLAPPFDLPLCRFKTW